MQVYRISQRQTWELRVSREGCSARIEDGERLWVEGREHRQAT